MIFDVTTLMSDNQAVTATALSTNVIDLGVTGTPYGGKRALNKDQGKGTPVPILIQVTEDFATLTSLTITLEVAAVEAMTSPTVLNTQTILAADLVAGKQLNMQCLPNGVDQRYLAARYTVTGSSATAGKIKAGITMGNQTNITGA